MRNIGVQRDSVCEDSLVKKRIAANRGDRQRCPVDEVDREKKGKKHIAIA